MQTLAEISVSRHGELARAVNERLDRMTHKVGTDLNDTARKTHESIAKLNERLAVIDTAQKNLTDLSSNMVGLQEILANKQARGAFGQMRMEAIVQDGLPKGAYTFQATLSNGKRPDCLLHMPNTPAGVVIDAKFPLEGFEAFRTARRDEEKKVAARQVRTDVGRHIDAMAERYLIAGETQDTAILFVPSEAIYADLAEHFSDIVQKAHRARIVICAPNMLMLAVQTMQAILKDVQMREQAHLIQARGGDADGGHGPLPRPGARSPAPFRPGQYRYREDPHLVREDRFARAQDRDLGLGGDGAGNRATEERQRACPLACVQAGARGRAGAAATQRGRPHHQATRPTRGEMMLETMDGSMLDQVIVGGGASLANLIVHAILLGAIAWVVRRLRMSDSSFPSFLQYTLVIVATGTLLVAGHFGEVVLWAYTYAFVGATPPGTDLVYFAFGNYTTLGYGDVVPVPKWHLLGPMTALNGVMLIGWSTALIFEILRRSSGSQPESY